MDALFGTLRHVTIVQECLRAILIFAYGLTMLRISGRRTFARWSALDIIISIIVGSSLSRAMTGAAPLGGTLAAVAVLVILHLALAFAVTRSAWLSQLVEGRAVMLIENGKPDESAQRRHFVSTEDLNQALRQRGLASADQAKAVHLEANGRISVVKQE